jgi:hypothetical protein
MERHKLMSKDERRASRTLLERWFEGLYLVRNVYLHGSVEPRTEDEQLLLLMRMCHATGHASDLIPTNGGPVKRYEEEFPRIARKRAEGLVKVGSDVADFLQSVLDATATVAVRKLTHAAT